MTVRNNYCYGKKFIENNESSWVIIVNISNKFVLSVHNQLTNFSKIWLSKFLLLRNSIKYVNHWTYATCLLQHVRLKLIYLGYNVITDHHYLGYITSGIANLHSIWHKNSINIYFSLLILWMEGWINNFFLLIYWKEIIFISSVPFAEEKLSGFTFWLE